MDGGAALALADVAALADAPSADDALDAPLADDELDDGRSVDAADAAAAELEPLGCELSDPQRAVSSSPSTAPR